MALFEVTLQELSLLDLKRSILFLWEANIFYGTFKKIKVSATTLYLPVL